MIEIATVTLACGLAAISLGGGLYETGIVDAAWPMRPDIVSPRHGGINRKWFWIPAHSAFELMLILSLALTWAEPSVWPWLLVALGSHAVMRLWSAIDFIPKALRFEAMEPADIKEADARRWTRRSRLRLLLDVVTCAAMFGAVVAVATLG
jgi:hypothetical protein